MKKKILELLEGEIRASVEMYLNVSMYLNINIEANIFFTLRDPMSELW